MQQELATQDLMMGDLEGSAMEELREMEVAQGIIPGVSKSAAFPPQYDDFLTHTYDPNFTADISTKMRVPDRIAAVNGVDPKYQNLVEEERARIIHRAASMNVPDKITVSGADLYAQELPYSGDEGENYFGPVGNPALWRDIRGASGESPHIMDFQLSNNFGSPRTAADDGLKLAQASIPTPGSGLVDDEDETDELLLMRRQISKLARHVAHLEDENNKRSQRELVLYPLVFGYVLFQLAKWMMQPR